MYSAYPSGYAPYTNRWQQYKRMRKHNLIPFLRASTTFDMVTYCLIQNTSRNIRDMAKALRTISIKGRTPGDKVIIGDTNSEIEIIDIEK